MTREEIRNETRYITLSNSSTYSDADFNTGLEIIRKRIMTKVIHGMTDWNVKGEIAQADLISTTGLVAGDLGYNGEYPFPTDLAKLIRIDVSYDGDYFYRAKQYFINDNDDSEETDDERDDMGEETAPVARIYRDSFFLRPLPDTTVTNGIRIKYQVELDALSGDSSEPEEFREVDHEIYVYAMAIRFGTRYPKKMQQEWKTRYQELERDLILFYANQFRKNNKLKTTEEDFS